MNCPKCYNTLYNYMTESCASCGYRYKKEVMPNGSAGDTPDGIHVRPPGRAWRVNSRAELRPAIQFVLWLCGGVLFLIVFEMATGFPWPSY